MSGKETVAVIIPTKNRPEFLDEAIASAQQQTYPPAEIIVVDDGSTVPLNETMLRARHGSNIKLLRNSKSHGLAYCRNWGVEACSSQYVIHLDDDDLLAPHAIDRCLSASRAHPQVEVWFFCAEGFGKYSDHFNKVQQDGVDLVCTEAQGVRQDHDIVLFDKRLFPVLLRRVPIAFQRVFTTPTTWTMVSRLRWRAYTAGDASIDESAAKLCTTGPLRDSEWALYAAAACSRTGLIISDLYMQRCSGQGYSSKTNNLERHMLQKANIVRQLKVATRALPELQTWYSDIRNALAQTYFDISFQYKEWGYRSAAWQFLQKSILARPSIKHLRLALRLITPLHQIRSSETLNK